jgi:alkanesulfonate monooxygenase SsuD/methylene tetrahydromethanopterin reductase-like flavin-dependent oxidoreductase (luciferase family)
MKVRKTLVGKPNQVKKQIDELIDKYQTVDLVRFDKLSPSLVRVEVEVEVNEKKNLS